MRCSRERKLTNKKKKKTGLLMLMNRRKKNDMSKSAITHSFTHIKNVIMVLRTLSSRCEYIYGRNMRKKTRQYKSVCTSFKRKWKSIFSDKKKINIPYRQR